MDNESRRSSLRTNSILEEEKNGIRTLDMLSSIEKIEEENPNQSTKEIF
jgi:hypothetical protein